MRKVARGWASGLGRENVIRTQRLVARFGGAVSRGLLASGLVGACLWAGLFVVAQPAHAEAATAAEDAEFFESQVRPLLVAHCAECHSRKTGEPEGGLSFDSRADFLAAEGVAVPGEPEKSLLVQVVRYDGDLQMPPDGKLPAAAIATLEEWVLRGLPWPADGQAAGGLAAFDLPKRRSEHWCWQPPVATPPPAVANAAWCRSDIDRFVLARLEAAGLSPAPEAPREVLVRRASELLTGLPADQKDLARVGADPDPLAFEKYVDQLLASPHYGERFARHWLDVVRYAETRGHEFDLPIPNAWRYRDWVLKAFNADLPYDQFVREQIAGDLLAQPRLDPQSGANESVVATGFWYLGEEIHSPVDIAQDDADRTDNRVDTFGKAFLGLALGCARCHDHKFDAISNEDYYAIAGMLMSSSYRQVPFETLEANRQVATQLAAADAEMRQALLPLVADCLAPLAGEVASVLPETSALEAAAGRLATLETAARSERVLADYTAGRQATPIIADAFAWGLAAVPAGQPGLLPGPDGQPPVVSLLAGGAARSDAIWAKSKSTGELDIGEQGKLDRAGRVLRTPKFRLEEGMLWYRVRGHLQILAVVDSHVTLFGPLHIGTLTAVDTKGQWQWVGHDLRSYKGHLVHVEFATKEGAAEVAEVVEAAAEPQRLDPLERFLAQRQPGGRPAVEQAAGELLAATVQACRDGTLCDLPQAGAMAALATRMLASPRLENVASAAVASFRSKAETFAAAREKITAEAKLVSATAPAILDGNGIEQRVLLKGSAARPGEIAPRRFLEAIDGPAQPAWPMESSGRRELAERVLDPANPLTARVAVNRFWHHLFGRGLVPTTDNFGKLGEPAADPLALALLDSLAIRFRQEGWSIKRLVKEIVTSSTWRSSSARDPQAVLADPLNRLFHHYPLRRLEGEAVRDKILAVSGRLDRTVGGPPVDVSLSDFHEGRGKPASGPLDGNGRRSLYTKIRRNFLPGFLLAFDMPVPFQAMGRRNVTNVPAQALTMMNDPFVIEQAGLWAKKILADESLIPEARVERMYLEAFARPPQGEEQLAAIDFLAQQAQRHGVDFSSNPRCEAVWADLAHALFNSKEFIFVP